MSILYIVATPIGNLNDISLRALDTLKTVDFIACEDTRHTKLLLAHYSITTPVFSYHEHNEQKSTDKIITLLKENKTVALVSDAGTPLISDPGYFVVRRAHELHIHVSAIPGACAAITALSASGLPSDRFMFEGFLPTKSTARQNRLSELKTETRTLIFYEAPHRIQQMIEDLHLIFGEDREVTLCRELTKTFETVLKTPLKKLLALSSDNKKGEFVVIVSGISENEKENLNQLKAQQFVKKLMVDLPLKKSVQLSAEVFQVSKNTLYQWALTLKR